MQWVPCRGSTQGTQGNSPEPLTLKNPAHPHASGHQGHRAAPSSSARTERLITARVDGEEDELPTAVLAHEVE